MMEVPGWLDEFAPAGVAEAFNARFGGKHAATLAQTVERHDDTAFRASAGAEVMVRKNHAALGTFRAADRVAALDHIGVASQLVFPTSANVWLEEPEHGAASARDALPHPTDRLDRRAIRAWDMHVLVRLSAR